MELNKRIYNKRNITEKIGVTDINIKQNNRTQDEVRLYNRLYYAYVLRHSQDYKHYTKEYHTRNREAYKYKYKHKQGILENMNKTPKIKIVELRVKIEYPTEENKFIVEI